MLLDLAKRAVPVLLSWYGTKMLVNQLAPRLPFISGLGTFAGPVANVGAVLGLNWATNQSWTPNLLKKHRTEIMLGAGLNLADSLFQAFAPASVKSMLGMGEYVNAGVGEYVGTGEYLDDDIAMNNYIAVGANEELGVDEALGIEEELGVDEALGASWDYGGLSGGIGGQPGASFQKQIPGQAFSRQVPQRSFARPVPNAGGEFDNPSQLYVGAFAGGFGS
jgi:hypothetical protein